MIKQRFSKTKHSGTTQDSTGLHAFGHAYATTILHANFWVSRTTNDLIHCTHRVGSMLGRDKKPKGTDRLLEMEAFVIKEEKRCHVIVK